MKILIYGLNFHPEIVGIGKYSGELAAWLVKAGHEVHVVTTPPYYPQWKVFPGYTSLKYLKETWKGVEIIRCPLWVPQKPSGITRILHLLSFAMSSWPAMLSQVKWKPDIVLNIIPTLFSSPCALSIARMVKAKSWLHIQDFELDAASNLGLIKTGNVVTRSADRWEKSILSRFDVVSSISNRMVARLNTKGIPQNKVVLFPNWIDTNVIFPVKEKSNAYRTLLGTTNNQFVVLYSGNMGNKQGLDLIIKVAHQMQEEKSVVFVLCGNGTARPQLEKASQYLKNVHFLDLQPEDKLNSLLNSADIHILPQQASAADLVMPSKLLGMLASGKTIIATANAQTELADVVNQTGIVVPPNNPEAIIQAIIKIINSNSLRKELGDKSREFVCSHWDQEKVLVEFLEQVKILIE